MLNTFCPPWLNANRFSVKYSIFSTHHNRKCHVHALSVQTRYLLHIRTCDQIADVLLWVMFGGKSAARWRHQGLLAPRGAADASQSLSTPAWIQDSCLGIPTGVKDSPEEEHTNGLPKKAFPSLFSSMWRKRYDNRLRGFPDYKLRWDAAFKVQVLSVCAQTKRIILSFLLQRSSCFQHYGEQQWETYQAYVCFWLCKPFRMLNWILNDEILLLNNVRYRPNRLLSTCNHGVATISFKKEVYAQKTVL